MMIDIESGGTALIRPVISSEIAGLFLPPFPKGGVIGL